MNKTKVKEFTEWVIGRFNYEKHIKEECYEKVKEIFGYDINIHDIEIPECPDDLIEKMLKEKIPADGTICRTCKWDLMQVNIHLFPRKRGKENDR